jgi:FixJ family two-component response regulator
LGGDFLPPQGRPFASPVNKRRLSFCGRQANARQRRQVAEQQTVQTRLASLTAREREVLERVMAGKSNKVMAAELGISARTVEVHRAHLMEKMSADSLAAQRSP